MGREGESDAELVAACRRGDAHAFGAIVERYQRAVCAVAYSHVRDRVLSEDIAQDTFVTAWHRLASLRDDERLPAWLCGIARNLARTRLRSGRREEPAELEVEGEGTPFDALSERQREAAVVAALGRVPTRYREPLVLFYCEQRSARDVARALGLSDAAVHQRLSRGRQYLASDAQVVEHSLDRRRPRRDLAAAVVAAIVLGAGSSHVEASPRTRGAPMKIVAGLLFTALAGTTTYAVATRSRGDAAPSSLPHAAQPIGIEQTYRSPTATGLPVAAPAAPALPSTETLLGALASRPADALPVSADCARAARKKTDLSLETPFLLAAKPEMMQLASKLMMEHWTQACASEHWSPEYMRCVLAATDPFSMKFDCHRYEPDHSKLVLEKGAFLVDPDSDRVVPATEDVTCAGIGKHAAQLYQPTAAQLDGFPEDVRKQATAAYQSGIAQMSQLVESHCTQNEWSEARRRCIAGATNMVSLDTCE
jgi:RNA polymerase sigma factor (sigma-70 family)